MKPVMIPFLRLPAIILSSFLYLFVGQVKAQEAPNCRECACPGGYFVNACSVRCCGGAIPACDCGMFENRCTCVGAPVIYSQPNVQNIREFATFLRSGVFTSTPANQACTEIQNLLKACEDENAESVSAAGKRVEVLLGQMPASEKSQANLWIKTRGGPDTTFD